MTANRWKNLSLDNIVEEIDGIVYTERWKPVKGYENSYQVSDFGRLKSIERFVTIANGVQRFHPEKIMKQRLTNFGHCYVQLPIKVKKSNRRYKTVLIHRLVGCHFIKNEYNKKTINHKHCIKTDNFYANLEWHTQSENTKHAYLNGLFTPPPLPLMAKRVLCVETGIEYPSIKEAAIGLGLSKSVVYNISCGRVKKHSITLKKIKSDS